MTQDTFNSLYDCIDYLNEKRNICGGDSIEFIADEQDESLVSEVKWYGSCHNLLATYYINN